jgi:hypothetical protein
MWATSIPNYGDALDLIRNFITDLLFNMPHRKIRTRVNPWPTGFFCLGVLGAGKRSVPGNQNTWVLTFPSTQVGTQFWVADISAQTDFGG